MKCREPSAARRASPTCEVEYKLRLPGHNSDDVAAPNCLRSSTSPFEPCRARLENRLPFAANAPDNERFAARERKCRQPNVSPARMQKLTTPGEGQILTRPRHRFRQPVFQIMAEKIFAGALPAPIRSSRLVQQAFRRQFPEVSAFAQTPRDSKRPEIQG